MLEFSFWFIRQKRTFYHEGQWRGLRRLRRTGAVDTKSPAYKRLKARQRRNFCARV